MKKIISATFCAAMLLSLTGCDNHLLDIRDRMDMDDDDEYTGVYSGTFSGNGVLDETSSDSELESIPESEPVPIPDIPVTGEGAFSYSYNVYLGGIVINDYLGDEQMIHIPSRVDGKIVVTVDLSKCNKPLTHIVLPNNVNDGVALSKVICSRLEYINVPHSFKTDSSGNFSNFGRLKSVTIDERITTIDDRAFANCKSLENLYIPKNVTSIGEKAFAGCESLKSITIPDVVTSIGYDAFSGCNNIRVAYKGKTYDYEHINDLYNAIRYDENGMKIEDGVLIAASEELTSVTIPDGVTEIGERAFYGCKDLASVVIPNSVTKIGLSAFEECTSLTSVDIPDSVTEISESAFNECTNLTNITYKGESYNYDNISALYDAIIFDENGLHIENGVLEDALESLTEVVIPDNVTVIGESAFQDCENITSVVIPDSVTEIRKFAFSGCKNLKTITLSNNVTWMGYAAFYDCDSMSSIVLPNSLIRIGERAFDDCDSLISIDIPDGVTEIGREAFSECENLTSISIPDSVIKIGKDAFKDSLKIKNATFKGRTYNHSDIESMCYRINHHY